MFRVFCNCKTKGERFVHPLWYLMKNYYFRTNTAKVLAGTSVSRVEPDTSMFFSTGWIASGRWMEFSAIGLSEWRVMTLPLVRALMPLRLSLMLWAWSLMLATLT